MTAGSISYQEFRSLVKGFVIISDSIYDKWRIEYGANNIMYMSKRLEAAPTVQANREEVQTEASPDTFCGSQLSEFSQLHLTDRTNTEDGDILSEMEIDLEADESCMPTLEVQAQQGLTFEYHVMYSESYGVPVLYFNVFQPDGKRLPLEEVWKLCPSTYQSYITENKWSTLTQQEHPVSGRPYLQLHPCHTSNLMAQITTGLEADKKKNYLVTWLSTVGPMAGLRIPHDYIT
ncbi:unnamed protein product [Candidula unifasciata]|uniref:Ubiquitin-like-conjugating enzyme ATG10 n=1 Tax=Candidula unifasciata TaxID=100452 RepID=A0A8S3Z111_9EUPU|nr:unnamed protein product [Candidula unifasciata]